jgi:hypothetical protein
MALLNPIEELVGSRDRREKGRAYARAREATDNLLESHRRFIETEALAKRVLALAEIQNPTSPSPITGFDLPPGLITQRHYRPC